MDIIKTLLDYVLHLDSHMSALAQSCGGWVYVILFMIIFAETGLVVTPFLPGDSLLFVLGALGALGTLNIALLIIVLMAAAISGNMVNYALGRLLASRIASKHGLSFIKEDYLQRTRNFYDTYGAKTIIITRFVPLIRTFAPFLAGVGRMPYGRFTAYNIAGGTLWVCVGVLSGYFFGNIPLVKKNFSLVIVGIVIISLIPVVIEYLKHKKQP